MGETNIVTRLPWRLITVLFTVLLSTILDVYNHVFPVKDYLLNPLQVIVRAKHHLAGHNQDYIVSAIRILLMCKPGTRLQEDREAQQFLCWIIKRKSL